ncbi:MAG: hypothetical protein IKR06_02105, partial [Erysipelotrichaceae bacterium]|nr:hypothetical protein [Erysipelotrichaceae bacterium]
MVKKSFTKGSIILQVGAIIAVCVILTGIFTHTSQFAYSVRNVTAETEIQAEDIAQETISAIREYPAHEWLLDYWYEHAGELDIEYDADHGEGTRTEEKCRLLSEHAPGFQLEYATGSEIEALSDEDQVLYAEIIYSWLITEINHIKRAHHVDFLFFIRTEEPYNRQFFLFSGADPGAVRGTEYEQVYPLGHTVEVTEKQQEGMASAIEHSSHIAEAGAYIDYYACMETAGPHHYLVGITYDQSAKLAEVRTRTIRGTIITLICLILLSILCSIAILFFVLKPLKKVQSNIRLYKDTKDSAAVIKNLEKIHMTNEIGELSADVIHLTKEIDDYLEKIRVITAEEERLQTEFALATNIQTALLP